jgi:hypothetical protein
MIKEPLSAKATVDIGITAHGSQQLVIALTVLAGIALVMTCGFLWSRHELWGWPAIGTIGLVAAACFVQAKSRPHLDRAGSKTTLTSKESGLSVQTDAITLADPQAAATLERLLASAFYRQPLPTPDGKVRGRKVDASQAAQLTARGEVEELNRSAEQSRAQTIELLTGGAIKPGAEVEQQVLEDRPAVLPAGIAAHLTADSSD